MNADIFRPYDIRGLFPEDLDEKTAYLIGKAYAEYVKPKRIAMGRDVRLSGKILWDACAKGLIEMGVDVVDLGVITTDMLYFAVGNYNLDGGIVVTGSHTPKQFNGFKMVKAGNLPISADSGIYEIRDLAVNNNFKVSNPTGTITKLEILDDYVDFLLTFVNVEEINKFKVVVNPNFGAASPVIEKIGNKLGLSLVKLNFEQDGNFPKGRPDPLIPELRMETSKLVKESKANLAAAWDADADRIYWYDEKGRFVDGCYEGSVLSQILLRKFPGEKIVHDIRLIWAAENTIKEAGGVPLKNKAGHSFIKERMREENAVFGFENSGHMFFRDYYYCDNGMLPWLMIMEEMSLSDSRLSEIVDPIRFKYPISEEVNFKVKNPQEIIEKIGEYYKDCKKDYTDGLSVDVGHARFNLRASNTGEPLIRLNVEAASREILDPQKAKLISIIKKDLADY